MSYDVIVAGQLTADMFPETSRLPLSALSSPGKLFEVGALEIATGGAVSNTGLALHRLGINVGLMTAVGDDLLGRVISERIKSHDDRLGDLIKIRPNEASAYSVILSPQNVDRIILTYPGSNAHFDVEDIDFALIEAAKIFHLGYPTLLPRLYQQDGEKLLTIFKRVYQSGVITSLDMTLPDTNTPSGQVDWKRLLERVLPYVDVFLPSLEEIVFMLRRADYDAWQGQIMKHINRAYLRELTDELLAMGTAISGIKLGEYGLYVHTTNDKVKLSRLHRLGIAASTWHNLELWHPAFAVKVVGTTGAGDCAYAGFLATLWSDLSPIEIVRFACAVGACNVEAHDAISSILSWADTHARIKAGWQTSDLKLVD
jgi:sugar/nucleoside kinase (ribokinase family)